MVTKEEFISGLGNARPGDIFKHDFFDDPKNLKTLSKCMPKGRMTPAGFIPHFRAYRDHIKFVFDLAANNGCALGCLYCFECPQDGRVEPANLLVTDGDILFIAEYKATFSDWFFQTFGEKCQWLHGEKFEIGAESKAKNIFRQLAPELLQKSKNWHITHYFKHPGAWLNSRALRRVKDHVTWLLTWSNGNHYEGLEPNARTIEERLWIIDRLRHKRLFAMHGVLSGPQEAWKFRRSLEERPWIIEASWTMYKFRNDEEQQYRAYVGCVGKHIASNLTEKVGGGFLAVGRTDVVHKIDKIMAGTGSDCKIVCDRKGQPAIVLKHHHNVRSYLVCSNGLGAAACPADNARVNGCTGVVFPSQNLKNKWKADHGIPQAAWDEAAELKVCAQLAASSTIALRYVQQDTLIARNNLKAKGLNYKHREIFAKVLQEVINHRESKRAILTGREITAQVA